ncbi:MAG: hypothetical protein ACPG4Y_08360 [Chitinophagales bacterium]
MKIATLNIDWAGKAKSKSHFRKIEAFLNAQDFDFLVLTEAINLELKNFEYKYFTEQIPEDVIYEDLDYTKYLNGEKAFRTVVYSKTACKKRYKVADEKTSLALAFETKFGEIILYTTIIGTWFKKQPFAQKELENCIKDCKLISKENKNLCIIGDLNTSFLKNEEDYTISTETSQSLKNLFSELELINVTENLKQNIDHIVIPKALKRNIKGVKVFVEKNVLSDHKGVWVELLR